MKTGFKKNIIFFLLILIFTFILIQKYKKRTPADSLIKIGLAVSLTGEAASWGEGALRGAEVAVKEINEKEKNKKFELVVEDEKCSAKGGVDVFEKLSKIDKVQAIVGPICSSSGSAGLPIANKLKIPTIILTATAPSLTDIGDYIFRIYPPDNYEGKFAASYIMQNLNKKKAAVVYVNNDYGIQLAEAFEKEFRIKGGEIVIKEGVNQDNLDLRNLINKIKYSSAEIVYFPVYPNIALSGLKQMREVKLNLPVFGGGILGGEEVIKNSFSRGLMYALAKVNISEELKKKINQKEDVLITSVLAYDAVKIFAESLSACGQDDICVLKKLKINKFQSISGSIIEFDENKNIKEPEYEVNSIK